MLLSATFDYCVHVLLQFIMTLSRPDSVVSSRRANSPFARAAILMEHPRLIKHLNSENNSNLPDLKQVAQTDQQWRHQTKL